MSESVVTWLREGAPSVPDTSELVEQLCRRLVATGLPLDRAAVFVRTLHPQLLGQAFYWAPDAPARISDAPHSFASEDVYRRSTVAQVMLTGETIRRRLTDPDEATGYPVLAEMREQGFTDYLIEPLTFSTGEVQAASFATRRTGGFDDAQTALLQAIGPPLTDRIELHALRRLAKTLLDTYVGPRSGARILSGAIRCGDVERIEAVILLTDLRGFTALSNSAEPEEVMQYLNASFDCIVPEVLREGGEVLKFMGDGLLAIFPIAAGATALGATCAAAWRAAEAAAEAVHALDPTPQPRCGMALHLGEVLYGNIGAGNRLDFTAIGPAVNLVARLEPLTAILDRRLVVSGHFAAASALPFEPLGEFILKGFPEPVTVYGSPA